MKDMSHEYLIKVFQTFLHVARSMDGEYFNYIPDEKFHIIFGSQNVYSSRKSRRHILNNKNYAKKKLFAPYEYTLYIINSYPLTGYSNTHPEAPQLYLDAFLIDNSLEAYQRVYLLLGNASNNSVVIKSYEKYSDGRIMSIVNNALLYWTEPEQNLISFVDIFISFLCEITSKCKLQRISSIVSLEEVIL